MHGEDPEVICFRPQSKPRNVSLVRLSLTFAIVLAAAGPTFGQPLLLPKPPAAGQEQTSSGEAVSSQGKAPVAAPPGALPAERAQQATSEQPGGGITEMSPGFTGRAVARVFTDNRLLSWLILIALILAGLAVGRTVSFVLTKVSARLRGSKSELRAEFVEGARGPANLALITAGIYAGLSQILMDPPVRSFAADVIALLIYIAVFWFIFNIIAVAEILLRRLTARTETKLDDMLVPLIRKTLRLFVVIVGILLIAENVFRQNIGTWLAGLGIAGIAVSLAAQDSLKNLFGSITILFDRPFKLGDRIVFSGYDGPVEEIGFRSIKIRTLTGHLVTVPNSKVVNEAVENIGARPYIRRLMNVTITYDTPREKVEQAVTIIRGILGEPGIRESIHGSIGPDELPPRVYFSDYNSESLNILVLYWFFPPAYWDYMDHAERFNLRLFEEFEKAGIEFAFPTRTLFLAGDRKRRLSLDVTAFPADDRSDVVERGGDTPGG